MSNSKAHYSPKLIYLLTLAEKQLNTYIKQHKHPDLPSATQAGVLFVLSKHEGLLMNELAEKLTLVPSAISGLIQRMEDNNLVIRHPCQEDGRATRIYLTNKAKQVLPELLKNTLELNQKLKHDFNTQELQIIEKWLEYVAFDLNKSES